MEQRHGGGRGRRRRAGGRGLGVKGGGKVGRGPCVEAYNKNSEKFVCRDCGAHLSRRSDLLKRGNQHRPPKRTCELSDGPPAATQAPLSLVNEPPYDPGVAPLPATSTPPRDPGAPPHRDPISPLLTDPARSEPSAPETPMTAPPPTSFHCSGTAKLPSPGDLPPTGDGNLHEGGKRQEKTKRWGREKECFFFRRERKRKLGVFSLKFAQNYCRGF
ncbi:hypothetical protein TIFTF001_013086 [Ficus carica]|uniref:Uncharacterized protein n=1 Tax=Ficus carica TaxID=3494 RepID=A0AA88ADK5_FICCA|nr:hypothetical protein TIFTF001_013086 [Ficus carica]